MFREALEKMVDPTRVKPMLQVGVDPLLSSEKKNPIIELDCKISLAYIVCFKVNMSFSCTRGFNLEKCMHSIDANINACPWRPIWKTFVL